MRTIIAAVAAISLAAGACEPDTVTPPVELQLVAAVEGMGEWQQINGQVTVTTVPGTAGFATTIQVAGDEPGAVRPWHVHHNSCAAGGGIVGEDADYPRLQIGADGTGTVTTTVPMMLDPAADYHVNIHLSEAETAVIIACGDLAPMPG
jgi:superoxide dismutase, Cu-Zn family